MRADGSPNRHRPARRAHWLIAAVVAVGLALTACGTGPTGTATPDGSQSSPQRSGMQKTPSSSPGPTSSETSPEHSSGSSPSESAGTATDSAGNTPDGGELPRGGKKIFPRYRVVSYYGTAGTSTMGILGSKPPNQIAKDIERAAAPFKTRDRKVQPAMELIVTVADSYPGSGHRYRHNIKMAQARRYLKAARAHHMLLVLDIQPGHGDFLPLVKHWSKLLAEPDVGLALDSEWHMPDGKTPGRVIGHSDADDINAVSQWLADRVHRRRLPQKLFLLHQFTRSMLRHVGDIKTHSQLATVQHLDGFGTRGDKLSIYRKLKKPKQFHMGFKLFYQQDINMMPPKRTLKIKPTPEFISYQ